MISSHKSHYPYTPLFCEENIWHLCHALLDQGLPAEHCEVIFLSNRNESIALFSQQKADGDAPVIWDYHVVLRAEINGQALIFDFDSRLDFPTEEYIYWQQSLPLDTPASSAYLADFRLIPATAYLQHFHSDRQHMKGLISEDEYPPGPCILVADESRRISLAQYRNMELHLPDGSQRYSYARFISRLQEQSAAHIPNDGKSDG